LSGPKPTMLASSVQSVVACYATAPRVCTLVLFIMYRLGEAEMCDMPSDAAMATHETTYEAIPT